MKRVAVLAAFQLLAILGWAGQQEYVRATAETFRIPLRPIDPYDVLRGRYFILNPRDGALSTGSEGGPLAAAEIERFLGDEKSFSGPAQVGFCPDGELWRICALAALGETPPAGAARFWSRARVSIYFRETRWEAGERVADPGWQVAVDLGLHRFFLPDQLRLPAPENSPGWELEACHRPDLAPLPLRLWYRGRPVWPR